MLITCKCLNVAINTKNSDIQNVDIFNLGLSPEELSDSFFQEVRECRRYAFYCIYSAFKTSMRKIQNIVNIQHTDNNKYIKFKVLNIITKTRLKI
jgi:hypothetical protein